MASTKRNAHPIQLRFRNLALTIVLLPRHCRELKIAGGNGFSLPTIFPFEKTILKKHSIKKDSDEFTVVYCIIIFM